MSAAAALPAGVYAQPSTVTYAQPGSVSHAQPGAVSYAQPSVVYAAGTAPQQMYSYVAPQQEPGVSAGTGGIVYAAPQISSNYTGVRTVQVHAVQRPSFPAIPSMVAYPGMPVSYMPTTVAQAWENHFQAFEKQDLDKIMLDYDEASVARIYDWTKGAETIFTGTAEIRACFAGLFAQLTDRSTMAAPVCQVEENPKTVFLCWKCPSSGILSATDTFIFGANYKVQRQNIVLTSAAPPASAAGSAVAAVASAAAAAGVSSAKAGRSSLKKASSKKSMGSKKKKNKSCC